MTAAVLLDGAPPPEGAGLPLHAPGALLGDAVFETLRAYGGRPFRLEAHLERLARSAAWARLALGAPLDTFATECVAVARAVPGDSAVRVHVLRGAAGQGRLAEQPTMRLVRAEPLAVRRDDYARGVAACVVPAACFGTSEGPRAKYARYLPRLLARDEAAARGANEALLADEQGRVVEAATACVVAVLPGGIVAASVLPSITRDVVVDLARAQGLPCELRPIEPEEIGRARELFVASSLREIVPIVRVDGRVIGGGAPGPTTRALHVGLRARAAAEGPPPWEADAGAT